MKETAHFLTDIYKTKFIDTDREEKRFELVLNKYLKAWEKQVQNNINKRYKKSLSYKSLFKALDPKDIEAIAKFRVGGASKRLASLGVAAANKGLDQAYRDMKLLLSWNIEMSPIADFYLQHYDEFTDLLSTSLQDRIKKIIARSIEEGLTTTDVHKQISETFSQPIIVSVPEKLSEEGKTIRRAYEYEMNKDVYTTMVARTEIQRALNNGRIYGYQEANIAKKLRWIANPGACEFCIEKNGEIFNVEETQDLIPLHPNCRCTFIVSEYKTFEESTEPIDLFDTSKIVTDPNGIGIMDFIKLSNEECDTVIKEIDSKGLDVAMKLLRRLSGGK